MLWFVSLGYIHQQNSSKSLLCRIECQLLCNPGISVHFLKASRQLLHTESIIALPPHVAFTCQPIL